jgi:queuine tRNA-ribosyltransferase
VRIKNARYALDERPIEEGCGCPVCRAGYSRAYIRHLVRSQEALGLRMCVMHNLYFYNNLMTQIRSALEEGRFALFKREMLAKLEGDGD